MKNKKIYFLGIGAIGMSALAQYFLSQHAEVYGYDLTPSPITEMLSSRGAVIHFDDNYELIPNGVDFVIYTPAVPRENQEFLHFLAQGTPMYKRSQILGEITKQLPSIAVAGTHGKTTTTSMVSHLLAPETHIVAFIGGIAKNFNDNLVLSDSPDLAVVEADEFDHSFLTLHPTVSVITSIDADHLDIYGDRDHLVDAFNQFANQSHTVLVEEHVAGEIQHPQKRIYGTQPLCDYYSHHIILKPNQTTFDLHTPYCEYRGLTLRANGLYNVLNATAALAAIIEERSTSLPQNTVADKLNTFAGVKRRFDYIIDRPDMVYIDDYAHHPEEMRSFVTTVRQLYPNKNICGIFQPHLYSRTRDFAHNFADVLSLLDEVILLPIYPAREEPIPGITSEYLLSLITTQNKKVFSKQ